jgi:DNA polymerase III subunit gamma/tau
LRFAAVLQLSQRCLAILPPGIMTDALPLEKLTDKYRPRRFADVIGQDHAVRFVSNLIRRRKIGHSMLFHGSVGSGKTTLARIYAKALNCRQPDEEGSPCDECDRCEAFRRGGSYFFEMDPGRLMDERGFKRQLDDFSTLRSNDEWVVLFFDEAQALSNYRGAFDALLKRVEDPPERVVYCFATTDIDSIPHALQSRLTLLEIRPLSGQAAMEFLNKIAKTEGIECEPEALGVIASFADRQPRDLLMRLDQIRRLDREPPYIVTTQRVRDVLGDRDSEQLVGYFKALASGDLAAQTLRILGWVQGGRRKLELVRLFLLAVYYSRFLSLDLVVDPLIASISEGKQTSVIRFFENRLASKGIELKGFWQQMLEFWSDGLPDESEAAIMLKFSRFHDFVNDCRASGRTPAQNLSSSPSARSQRMKRPAPRVKRQRPPSAPDNPKYLDYEKVTSIINTASRCVQAYGLLFNMRIVLWHSALGNLDAASAADSASDFTKELSQWIKNQRQRHPVIRLTMQGHDQTKGFYTETLVHIPEGYQERARHWASKWVSRLSNADATPAYEIDPCAEDATQKQRVKFHWKAVRWLCRGVNPSQRDFDQSHDLKPLIDLLDIRPKDLAPAGDIGGHRRLTQSASLEERAFEALEENKIPFLSAFDDRAWEQIPKGWEIYEHSDRDKVVKERKSAVVECSALHANASDEDKRDALNELMAGWSDDPHRRQRSWPIWW